MATTDPVPAEPAADAARPPVDVTGTGRLVPGIAVGAAAALVGAVAWAAITVTTDIKSGFVAVGIGLLVGLAIERVAGTDGRLPIAGAAVALLGCLVGDVLTDVHLLAHYAHVSDLTALRHLLGHPNLLVRVYRDGFQGFDLVFYAIAGYEGWRFSRRGVQRARMAVLRGRDPLASPGV